ncbi:MAG: EAL domain-containing protein [Firmicutes bacterium]|nr:EAL domain-containing protein [Bacillota bacterium]
MKRRKAKIQQNSLAKRIVSLTVFLDALFLVIIMAIISFVYIDSLTNSEIRNAELESNNAVTAIHAFIQDTTSDVFMLAEDEAVINYLTYLQTGSNPIITDTLDPNYLIYNEFILLLESVKDYSSEGVYDFLFVATDTNCSTGEDGCFVGTSGQISDDTWTLQQRPWFIELGQNDFVFTGPYIDSLSSEDVLTFVSKVYNGEEVIGYLGIDVLVSTISSAIYEYDYYSNDSQKALAIFVEKDGVLTVLHYSDAALPGYQMLDEPEVIVLDQAYGYPENGLGLLIQNIENQDNVQKLSIFGTDYSVSFSYLDDCKWTVAVLVEKEVFIGIEIIFLFLVVFILILMILVAIILSKKINKTLSPVSDILHSIEEIKNGNYNIDVQISENNELKNVADALNIMSKEIGKQVDLVYQSYLYDSLTGLKNRKSVHSEIDEQILKPNEKVAICLLDVDNLKDINVTKGQMIGDELIKAIALRLQKTLPNNENILSNSSNEFVFIIKGVKSLEIVETEVLKVLESFIEPFEIKNIKVEVKIHIGISIFPSDGKNMSELMKKCDTALYKAREAGFGKYIFYNDQLTREVNYHAQISDELAVAIEKHQLYLKYQPLIDNKNEIYGFEALVRWKSPTLGEISPQVFIANAEESRLIIPIGTWILESSCQAQVEFAKKFKRDFVMSVNVSPVQILQKNFIDVLKRIIRETNINPRYLVLEITEGVLIESTIYLEETINYLHAIGAKIALDDFGTGYASLTYLRKIPFDNLKIDKSFVDGIFGGKKDHSIIGTIVELVHNLDMKVVAEGIETKKQYEYLKQISTDIFQGFLFSKPLTYDETINYIDQFYKVAKMKRIDVFAAKDYYE